MGPMTDILFGALAFLALLGWGITNAITSRNNLREANALDMIEKVENRIDDRVTAVVNRFREISAAKRGEQQVKSGQTILDDAELERRERMRQGLSLLDGLPEADDLPPIGQEPIYE
jgi:hypothetical protein